MKSRKLLTSDDVQYYTLVTCIKILSPVNKREPGLTPYRQKRQRLYGANVHLEKLDDEAELFE